MRRTEILAAAAAAAHRFRKMLGSAVADRKDEEIDRRKALNEATALLLVLELLKLSEESAQGLDAVFEPGPGVEAVFVGEFVLRAG